MKFLSFLVFLKYNLETYIHERWLPMMPSGKFVQSSGCPLFPIFCWIFCFEVIFLFHPDPVHFFLLLSLDLTDTCLFFVPSFMPCSLIFGVRFLNILSSFVAVVVLIERTVSDGGSAVFP